MRSAVLSALLLSLASAHAFDWQPCDDGPVTGEYADIDKVSLSPQTPAAGVTVDFEIDGTAKIDVGHGSLEIGVIYSGLPIFSETRDLCDMARCPITKGPLTISYEQYLPPIMPPGPYNVTLNALSEESKQLLCINVQFDVTPPMLASAANVAKLRASSLLHRQHAQA